MAAGRGGCPVKWGAASPAEAIRAEPATVAAAQAGLCRSADAIGDALRCLVGPPVRAEAGVLLRAGDRDGLRCRAEARDTYGLRLGADSRSAVTRILAQACPAASGVRAPRGSGRRHHQKRWSPRTLG